jgi:phosphoribosylamine--glycine ligase
LVIVGPDNPLADGIVDVFQRYGIRIFGPSSSAAQIEASKSFAKHVMRAAGVPTAEYWTALSEEEARSIILSVPSQQGLVIKADGLALGKGVVVCNSQSEALAAARDLIKISGKLVIEEKLNGEELSWMAFCDGERCALLEPARDYKRLLDRDQGPNTGGMGAISPVPGVPDSWSQRVKESVFLPTLRELKRRGCEFRGILFAGLMVDLVSDRFWVLEFNARFGDPETQVLMARLEGDLFPWCDAAARGDLSSLPSVIPFRKESAVYVVAGAKGYPERPESGQPIHFSSSSQIFFAGVRSNGSNLVTAGGRVLGALGMGEDLEKARETAYHQLNQVKFEGMQFRSDIGTTERLK